MAHLGGRNAAPNTGGVGDGAGDLGTRFPFDNSQQSERELMLSCWDESLQQELPEAPPQATAGIVAAGRSSTAASVRSVADALQSHPVGTSNHAEANGAAAVAPPKVSTPAAAGGVAPLPDNRKRKLTVATNVTPTKVVRHAGLPSRPEYVEAQFAHMDAHIAALYDRAGTAPNFGTPASSGNDGNVSHSTASELVAGGASALVPPAPVSLLAALDAEDGVTDFEAALAAACAQASSVASTAVALPDSVVAVPAPAAEPEPAAVAAVPGSALCPIELDSPVDELYLADGTHIDDALFNV